MKSDTLLYYCKEDDPEPKGIIDLTEGRGVRNKNKTHGLEWPDEAKDKLSFGLAIEGRTFYLYGTDPEDIK